MNSNVNKDINNNRPLGIDVHADDYGLTMHTSKRILEGIEAGKLDSVSVMPNMDCFEEANALWKANSATSNIKISVHLNFMEGYCLADPQELSMFVNAEGLFVCSWIELTKINYDLTKRKQAKEQLKKEILAQINRVGEAYELDMKALRIDSHQHSHMISWILEALLEVANENGYSFEYIRNVKEWFSPYLKQVSLLSSYSPINIVKVLILNWFAFWDKSKLKDISGSQMVISGVFMSGMMDIKRVNRVIPAYYKRAGKKGLCLELLFHPGQAFEDEVKTEFNHNDNNCFYLSNNRNVEYEAMMGWML